MVLFYAGRARTQHHSSEGVLKYYAAMLKALKVTDTIDTCEYLIAKEHKGKINEHWQCVLGVKSQAATVPEKVCENIRKNYLPGKKTIGYISKPPHPPNSYSLLSSTFQMLEVDPRYIEKLSYPLKEYVHLSFIEIQTHPEIYTNIELIRLNELYNYQKYIAVPKYEKTLKEKKLSKPEELLISFSSYLKTNPWETRENGCLNLEKPGSMEYLTRFLLHHFRMKTYFFDFAIFQKHYYLIQNKYDPEPLFRSFCERMFSENKYLLKSQFNTCLHDYFNSQSKLISDL